MVLKNSIDIIVDSKVIKFSLISINIEERNIASAFFKKNNKSLKETLENEKYYAIKNRLEKKYKIYGNEPIGNFLKRLKESNNTDYLHFLNRYGDNNFCHFAISQFLFDKGIYCFKVGDMVKYVGRCTDSFKKRINQGYGKISPKNCFIDGQATNCHVNSLINQSNGIQLGICVMNDYSNEEIKKLEKSILANIQLEWNIQKK